MGPVNIAGIATADDAKGASPRPTLAIAPHASSHSRIEDIEVLRAVAITCVLVQHSLWNLVFNVSWLQYGLVHAPLWCGVDLFFVVSGFVISRSILPRLHGTGKLRHSLRSFWIRRVFRLWPAAWLWLALILFGSLVFRRPAFMGSPNLNLMGAAAAVFGYADIRVGLHPFATFYGPSMPYWSLSLEEQFYILLPPVILLVRRHLPFVVLFLLLMQLPLPHPRLYFFCRNDGLLWGVLLASSPALSTTAISAARRIARVKFSGLAILFVALGAMTQLSPPFEQSPPFWLGTLAAVAAIPVWLGGADRNLFRFGKLQQPVLWLGSRSYALYLCHDPIYQCAFALARHIALPIDVNIRSAAIGLPLLALAAECSYRLVETPLRRFGAGLAARLEARGAYHIG
jgi:peptidoglycan/LPS O-acetylase OafA/YrhL